MMTITRFCLVIGLILGIVTAFGGWIDLLIVLGFAFVGLIVGRVLEGKIDLGAVFGRSNTP